MKERLVRWQLWLGVVLGGYVLVRAALDRDGTWVAVAVVLLGMHVYRELTRPLSDSRPPDSPSDR